MTKSGTYRHSKTGKLYLVWGTGVDATNGAPPRRWVVYAKPMNEWSDDEPYMFIRDEDEFHEEVTLTGPDGEIRRAKRFVNVEEESK